MTSLQSLLYGTAVSARNAAYDLGIFRTQQSGLKVICVGNITTGGSGKSPVTQALAKLFRDAGLKPAVLLRGYRGRERGPLLVTSVHKPEDVGDEACMHRDALSPLPVIVSRKRVDGARFISSEKLGQIVILDDGFQHRALARNMNLLLFDRAGLDEAAKGDLLPSGNLREDRTAALRRASAVLLIERGDGIKRPDWLPAEIPSFIVPFSLVRCTDLATNAEIPWEDLRQEKITLISSIARPEQFREMLRGNRVDIVSELTGKDHERWSRATVEKLNAMPGDLIITTAKDAVKLRELSGLKKPVGVAGLEARLPDTFRQWLLSTLS